jgi:DNA repair exonuclease SbcCD ATPase subunit
MAKKSGATSGARSDAASSLVDAALSFDAALARFAELTDGLRKGPLDSRRNLERAAETLREVASTEEELATRAQQLMAALAEARDIQQAQAEAVRVRAEEIQSRTMVLRELLVRYEALGTAARELNVLGQKLAGTRPTPDAVSDAEQAGTWRVGLKELFDKMTDVAGGAEELVEHARRDQFEDIARQADSLRQQLLSARNKVNLLQTSIGTAPAET